MNLTVNKIALGDKNIEQALPVEGRLSLGKREHLSSVGRRQFAVRAAWDKHGGLRKR